MMIITIPVRRRIFCEYNVQEPILHGETVVRENNEQNRNNTEITHNGNISPRVFLV